MEQGEALRMLRAVLLWGRGSRVVPPSPLVWLRLGRKGLVHRRRPGGCQDAIRSWKIVWFFTLCGLPRIGCDHPALFFITLVTIILVSDRRTAVILTSRCIDCGPRRSARRTPGEDVWLSGQEEHPPHHSECWGVFSVAVAEFISGPVPGVWACGCGCGMSPGRRGPCAAAAALLHRSEQGAEGYELLSLMHFADASAVLLRNLLRGDKTHARVDIEPGRRQCGEAENVLFLCSIFATSARLRIEPSLRWTSDTQSCCRVPVGLPLFVTVCMAVEISRRGSLLGGVSGGRVSLHTNWWGKCFPASAVTLSTRLDPPSPAFTLENRLRF